MSRIRNTVLNGSILCVSLFINGLFFVDYMQGNWNHKTLITVYVLGRNMNTIAICFNKEITHFRKVIKDGNLHYRIF
jgi:hypothetical protein